MRLSPRSKKLLNVYLAVSLAFFFPLTGATLAYATTPTLEEAQAQLTAAQQELTDAQAALAAVNADVTSATDNLATAQTAYNDALTAYNATQVAHPGTTTTSSQNVVQNGQFNDASAWSGIAMYQDYMYNNSNIALVMNGILKGSYSSGNFYMQQGTFTSPVRNVTFSVDVWNNDNNNGVATAADYYRIEFRTYAADGTRLNYYNLQWSNGWHDWITRSATYTLSQDAVRWDVGFRLADGGYWNGNYGPAVDNVQVIAQVATTSPTTYTYGEAETQALQDAQANLTSAQAALTAALADQATVQQRVSAAEAEMQRLTLLVAELTPHINAPTNLTAELTSTHVNLSWSAPTSNLSGVTLERYAIMWSTTHFTQNGWGWVHDQTSVSIPLEILNQNGGLGSTFQFQIRADNDTLAIYSPYSNVVSVLTQEPQWWQIQFDEGQQVSISAPAGYVFSTPRGWYGTPDGTCGLDVTSVITPLIQGNATASFSANNALFTDPCPGWGKVLRLSTPVVVATVVEPTPAPEPEITPTPTTPPSPTPTETPQPPVVVEPTPTPEPGPAPSPTPTPAPEPQPEPQPSQTPEPTPTPTPTPTPEPTIEPNPEPTTPVEPEPEPTQPSEPEPTPEPEPTVPAKPEEPAVVPEEEPSPEPTPSVEPEEPTEEEPITSVEDLPEEITASILLDIKLDEIVPTDLTPTQAEAIKEAALEVFETAAPGSAAYEQALDALLVAAQADDIVVDEELASIPGIGAAAVAVAEVLNLLSNVGADMNPEVREDAQKATVAAVIVGQIAGAAIAATSAAAPAAASRRIK